MKAVPAMSTPRVGCAATSSFGSRSSSRAMHEPLLVAAREAAGGIGERRP